jgi:c(7)-type cytochrome triheme protein
MNKKIFLLLIVLLVFYGQTRSQPGVSKKRPLPSEHGRVVINNYSDKADLAPVVFEHWIHRSKFSCRVCHVDVGFAMKAGATGITAADNARGFYCGACHNGKLIVPGETRTVFQSCARKPFAGDRRTCDRCHSYGLRVESNSDIFRFGQPLPKGRFGNGFDWGEKSGELGLIRPVGILEGAPSI